MSLSSYIYQPKSDIFEDQAKAKIELNFFRYTAFDGICSLQGAPITERDQAKTN